MNWGTVVAPKLSALEGLLGSQAAALALLQRVPEALKHPAESRLVPNLRLLRDTCGLEGEVGEAGRGPGRGVGGVRPAMR